MKTQIMIYVDRESIISRFWGRNGLNFFSPTKMAVGFDSESKLTELSEREEPYVFDVEPGTHVLYFADPRAGWKKMGKGFMGFIFGIIGGLGTALDLANFAAGNSEKSASFSITLNEGDAIKIACKPTGVSGAVKAWVVNDR